MILAAIDSLVFCFIVYLAFLKIRINRNAKLLFFCGIIYMLLQALFAFNYGNLLRVRYPGYIFFLAAVCCTYDNKYSSGFRSVGKSRMA